MAWTAYGPLGPVFKKDFGLSLILLGIIIGAPKVLALPTRYIAGYMSDRIGARVTMIIFLVLSVVALFATSFSSSFVQFLIAASLLGVAGGIFPIGIAYVDRIYSSNIGSLLGIYGGIGNAGSAFSGILVPILFERFGFSGVFIALSVILVLPLILTILSPSDIKENEIKDRKVSFKDKIGFVGYTAIAISFLISTVIASKSLYIEASLEFGLTSLIILITFLLYGKQTGLLSYVYYLTFGGFLAVGLWIPTVFVSVFKDSLLEGGIVLFFSVISAAIFRPLGGLIGDKLEGKKASVVGVVLVLVSSIMASIGLVEKSLPLSIISFISLGSALSFANGAVFKLVSESYSIKDVGKASGIIGGIGGFGGFSISAGIGITGSIGISLVPLIFVPLSVIAVFALLGSNSVMRLKLPKTQEAEERSNSKKR